MIIPSPWLMRACRFRFVSIRNFPARSRKKIAVVPGAIAPAGKKTVSYLSSSRISEMSYSTPVTGSMNFPGSPRAGLSPMFVLLLYLPLDRVDELDVHDRRTGKAPAGRNRHEAAILDEEPPVAGARPRGPK